MLRAGLTPSASAADYLKGNVKVDEYVTHGYKLADINEGFDAMHVSGFCFVSVSYLTVLSRKAIAFVVSSTCHKFRRKGGEGNQVYYVCIMNGCIQEPARETNSLPFGLFGFIRTWRVIRAFFQLAPNGACWMNIRVVLGMAQRRQLKCPQHHPEQQRSHQCIML